MPQMLVALGLPRDKVYFHERSKKMQRVHGRSRGFWDRSPEDLHNILDLAKVRYRQLLDQVHPDKPGGDHAQACALIRLWKRIQKAAAEHGFSL